MNGSQSSKREMNQLAPRRLEPLQLVFQLLATIRNLRALFGELPANLLSSLLVNPQASIQILEDISPSTLDEEVVDRCRDVVCEPLIGD